MKPLVVVGVGNRDRGDDAVGPTVCDRLDRDAVPGVRTAVVETGGLDLLAVWDPDDAVVVVDAARPAGRPGRVHHVDALDQIVRAPGAVSTHEIDVMSAIELARVVDRLPASLSVIGVEGATFGFGDPLSHSVAAAVDGVVATIRTLAGARAARPSPRGAN